MHLEFRSVGVRDITAGNGVVIVEPCNIYGARLGDHVFVGPFSEIQKDVVVGSRTRIQSHSFICQLVTIGSDCFIGHGVMFVNDRLRDGPAHGDTDKWERTKIGNGVSIGSNTTVLPVVISSGVVIGAGSVVTNDILEPGTYAGNPARRLA